MSEELLTLLKKNCKKLIREDSKLTIIIDIDLLKENETEKKALKNWLFAEEEKRVEKLKDSEWNNRPKYAR